MRHAILAIAALGALPSVANAFTYCAERTRVTEQLAGKYSEVRRAGGMNDANTLMEVWASPETGTWTLLMTRADGTSCILASGTHWALFTLPPRGEES